MEKHLCSGCEKEFSTAESLEQHRQAKHTAQPAAAPVKKKPGKGLIIVAVLALAVVVGYFAVAGRNSSSGDGEKPFIDPNADPELQKMLSFNLRQHTASLALHIHPVLEIEILGRREVIPADIGISKSGMRVIHTHDASGTLHIESPKPFQFHLKDFFTIWGRNFNSTCVFDYCADETHEMAVYVNDIRADEPEKVPLRDHDRILIIYSEKR